MLNPQMRRFVAVLAMVFMLAALALPHPALAQEAGGGAEAGSAPASVQGVTALLLMLGLGAVALVGLYYVAENQAARRRESERRDREA